VPPTTTIVRITVPATTERVIVIVMSENAGTNGPQEYREEIHLVTNQPNPPFLGSIPPSGTSPRSISGPSQEENELIKRVKWAARDGAEEIKEYYRNGYLVIMNASLLDDEVRRIINAYLRDNRSGEPPLPSETRRLQVMCNNAYQSRLQEELEEDQAEMPYIASEEEIKLRELAIQDREESPTYDDRDWHIRDIAVVRVLQVLNAPISSAKDNLAVIHKLADRYQDFYREPGRTVVWPSSQRSF
jgi:hypothetical protein